MAHEITLESLRQLAEQAGLKLAEDELQRLLPGVTRARNQIAELRELLAQADEPAVIFNPSRADRK